MKKNLKPFLKQHDTGEEAVERTKKANVTAVKVTTYSGEEKVREEFYSFKTKAVSRDEIWDAFPLALGSNQTLMEIDANDY